MIQLPPRRRATAGLLVVALLGCSSGCSNDPQSITPGVDMALGGADLTTVPSPSQDCVALALPVRAWNGAGPYGKLRDTLADDFTLADQNGDWHFQERFSGCESYVFVPDSIVVSSLDASSIWQSDLDDLIARSPNNVHYFFVSRKTDPSASLQLIGDQIDAVLSALPEGSAPGAREWWRARIHLVQKNARGLGNWVGDVLNVAAGSSSVGVGFAIDRSQRLRSLGSLSDVTRQNGAQNGWPFDSNLGYAAHPPQYFNYEADRQARLDAAKATVVTAINHEMLKLTDERSVAFPDAATIKTFDTLLVDLDMNCQSNTRPEEWQISADLDPMNYNCGPWDYIVNLELQDAQDPMKYIEIARFISTYHRAGHYLADASHVLPLLAAGGARKVRYNVSVPWNQQTYDTVLNFRFSTSGAAHPTSSTFLFAGGAFDDTYNAAHATPVTVKIPATAKKVELRAIITGHGSDSPNSCGEFCNHQHEFTVGAMKFKKEYPMVGDPEGCLKQIGQGQVPNQSGTWWYGRGGWCPGMQVDPYVVDVTSAVTAGQDAAVSYRALFKDGAPPKPKSATGNIVLNSWLVIWE